MELPQQQQRTWMTSSLMDNTVNSYISDICSVHYINDAVVGVTH